MKQRPQTGLYLRSTSISAQHKNGAKKQMKKSQTSERKNTQTSLIFHLFFLCLILSMTSCSVKSDYQFKDSTDALKQYRDFHHRARDFPTSSAYGRNFLIQSLTISRKILPLLLTPICPCPSRKLQIPSVLNFYDWLLDVTFLMWPTSRCTPRLIGLIQNLTIPRRKLQRSSRH